MNSEIIQSLWIGPRLSNMEHLCIKSFIDFGHEFHLYTYDKVDNIPEGVIVKDGNEILPASEIYRYKNGSVSAFSNLFRFTMLFKRGGYWVDTDLACIRPFKFDKDYVVVTEPSRDYRYSIVTSCFMKLPKGSDAARTGMIIQQIQKKKILTGEIDWGSGPKTMQEVVMRCKLQDCIVPWYTVCSCNWTSMQSIVDPTFECPDVVIKDYNNLDLKTQ